MRHWQANQKLTNQQIETIKFLRAAGFSLSLIGQALNKHYGVSVSIAYYHASENRASYDNVLRQEVADDRLEKKQLIRMMIKEGMTTKQVAEEWGVTLSEVNKIYCT